MFVFLKFLLLWYFVTECHSEVEYYLSMTNCHLLCNFDMLADFQNSCKSIRNFYSGTDLSNENYCSIQLDLRACLMAGASRTERLAAGQVSDTVEWAKVLQHKHCSDQMSTCTLYSFSAQALIVCTHIHVSACLLCCSVWLLKRFLHWFYVKRIRRNGTCKLTVYLKLRIMS